MATCPYIIVLHDYNRCVVMAMSTHSLGYYNYCNHGTSHCMCGHQTLLLELGVWQVRLTKGFILSCKPHPLGKRVWYFAMERFVLNQAQRMTHGSLIIISTQCTAVNQHPPIIVGNHAIAKYQTLFPRGCGLRDYLNAYQT
jgi:hypothetical protein